MGEAYSGVGGSSSIVDTSWMTFKGPDSDDEDWPGAVGTDCHMGEYGGREVYFWLQRCYGNRHQFSNITAHHTMRMLTESK